MACDIVRKESITNQTTPKMPTKCASKRTRSTTTQHSSKHVENTPAAGLGLALCMFRALGVTVTGYQSPVTGECIKLNAKNYKRVIVTREKKTRKK